MLKLMIRCTQFENNYSNNTCQSSENVASIVQVLKEKNIKAKINFYTKMNVKFSFVLH